MLGYTLCNQASDMVVTCLVNDHAAECSSRDQRGPVVCIHLAYVREYF